MDLRSDKCVCLVIIALRTHHVGKDNGNIVRGGAVRCGEPRLTPSADQTFPRQQLYFPCRQHR